MDKIIPIRSDELQNETLTMHDRALRRQLHLSVIVVVVLLVATVGAMLSLRPVVDGQQEQVSGGAATKPAVMTKAAG